MKRIIHAFEQNSLSLFPNQLIIAMVDTTHIVFFSPTHTSAKIARAIGDGIGMERRIETDLTLDESITPI